MIRDFGLIFSVYAIGLISGWVTSPFKGTLFSAAVFFLIGIYLLIKSLKLKEDHD